MSSDTVDVQRRIDKGKGRARSPEPTEATPLLTHASGSYTTGEDVRSLPRRLYPKLISVFLVSLSVCILGLILIVLVLYIYRSRAVGASPDQILQNDLVVKGPDRVEVLNMTGDGGIWLMAHGRIGLDAGDVAGVNTEDGDNILDDVWKSLGRWGIRRLDKVVVNLSTIEVTPEGDPSHPLTTITLPMLEVPLTANPPNDNSWLTHVAVPVLIRPTKDAKTLLRFMKESWRDGTIRVRASVAQAVVQGGGLAENSWRRYLKVMHNNIDTAVHISIPRLPGLPRPGANIPFPNFSDLVTLQSFLINSKDHTLSIHANATTIDPVPTGLNFTAPPIQVIVSLPRLDDSSDDNLLAVPLAAVETRPFTLTYPNITLAIDGQILPLPRNSSEAVSAFLANFVSARDSEILLSSPFLPSFAVSATFPAPRPRPQILRDVTIKDMKIKPVGSGMVASGTVYARVVLPKGIEVGLDVGRVFPDVLVYDGPAPEYKDGEMSTMARVLNYPIDDADRDVPPEPPLPDPLPERAFAHIRPMEWLPSESQPTESEDGEGSAVSVSAKIVDVPLEVLPGREREFSNFVSKVVFSTHGAVAGVQGVAAVAVNVQGLPFENGRDGDMELTGLPFRGNVHIGKRAILD